MKPTILLTGKTGQVGFELNRSLSQLGKIFAPDHRDLDLLNQGSVRRAIRDIRPQLIVNAAAYTAVDAAENDESKAYAVNAEALALLADEAKRLDALVVHYSTDYVFDGTKRSPYNETDETNPLNVYGKSKLAGEQAIRASGASHLIIRTGWVYANRGRNFLLTATAILGKAQSVSPEVPWFAAATQGRPLIAKRILPISSDEFRSPTRRPIYSVLSNSRLSEIFHIELPNWTTQLQCCLATEKIDGALLRSASTPGS